LKIRYGTDRYGFFMTEQLRFVVSHPFAKNANGWGPGHFLNYEIVLVVSQVPKCEGPGAPRVCGVVHNELRG